MIWLVIVIANVGFGMGFAIGYVLGRRAESEIPAWVKSDHST
jgi:hypothetical protein